MPVSINVIFTSYSCVYPGFIGMFDVTLPSLTAFFDIALHSPSSALLEFKFLHVPSITSSLFVISFKSSCHTIL
ncbi:MAG: hypothetical protein L6V81_01590 [Clostridium sp.]|nr:MAG: hypothetical protein L6V81_01590 [Clostridium sp.]